MKTKLLNYLKSSVVSVSFALMLAHGPCGGAFIGLLLGLFIGFTLSAFIWLLEFKWYWNLLAAPIISGFTLGISFFIMKILPSLRNELVFDALMICILASVFILMVELTNFMVRLLKTKEM